MTVDDTCRSEPALTIAGEIPREALGGQLGAKLLKGSHSAAADVQAPFLRSPPFPVSGAARTGLINVTVPPDHRDAELDDIVPNLLAESPAAIPAAQQLVLEVVTMPVDGSFAWTRELSAHLFGRHKTKEGTGAFLEKRPAAWVVTR